MSYWLGRHSVNESAHSISSKHEVAVSPEPEGATFGWLVECRCGWQARVVKMPGLTTLQIRSVLEGTGLNHFDRHIFESVTKEIIWPSSLVVLEKELKKPLPTQGQQLVPPSVGQQVPPLGTSSGKPPVVPSPETKKVAGSPSLQPSVASQTPVVKTVPTPSPSTGSQVASTESQQPSVQTSSSEAQAPGTQTEQK